MMTRPSLTCSLAALTLCFTACGTPDPPRELDASAHVDAQPDAMHSDARSDAHSDADLLPDARDMLTPVEDAPRDATTLDADDAHTTEDAGADQTEPAEDTAPDLLPDAAPTSHPWHTHQAYQPGAPSWGDDAIWIGSGKDQLEFLLQGSVMRWEAGPQGGYHLWVGASVGAGLLGALSDEERRQARVVYSVWREDGTLLATTQRLGAWNPSHDATAPRWVNFGQYAVLEAPIRPRRMDGEQLLYQIALTPQPGLPTRHRAVWITSLCCD